MKLKWDDYLDGKTICLDTELDGRTWEEVGTQLVDALVLILGRIASDLKPLSWNRIYLELWADSGRIIIYPHKRGRSRSDRLLTAQIYVALFQKEHDKLPVEVDDPDLFESHLGAMLGKVSLAIDDALENKRVRKLIRRLAEQTDFTVWLQEADDTESMGQLWVL